MPSRTYQFRGQRTHGRGRKSGRGAGKQGGRGNAGLHKHKFMSMLKYAPDHFGRRGFKRHVLHESKIMNIKDLNVRIENFLKDGIAKYSDGLFQIDLNNAGYTKLLGTGTPAGKYRITISSASKNAINKITGTGGEVITEDAEIEKKTVPIPTKK